MVDQAVLAGKIAAVTDAVARIRQGLPGTADARWSVPASHADVFRALAEHGILDHDLAGRLVSAAGFRNLVAHQDGVIGVRRVHAIASQDLDDLLEFCHVLAGLAHGRS